MCCNSGTAASLIIMESISSLPVALDFFSLFISLAVVVAGSLQIPFQAFVSHSSICKNNYSGFPVGQSPH